MLGKEVGSAIGLQVGATNDVANGLWNEIIRRVQTKNGQNNLVHTST